MIVKGDASGYVRTNLEFHRTLYLRAQAPAMLGLIETVWLQAGPTMRMLYERLQRRQASDNHRKIIAALQGRRRAGAAARDPDGRDPGAADAGELSTRRLPCSDTGAPPSPCAGSERRHPPLEDAAAARPRVAEKRPTGGRSAAPGLGGAERDRLIPALTFLKRSRRPRSNP